jgi:hypothetical protein
LIVVERSDGGWLARAAGPAGGIVSRRGIFALAAVAGLGACSNQPSKQELTAKDPYLPRLRADPMYAWRVEGADRQVLSETPYDPNSYGETKNSQIIVEHVAHAGVDLYALLHQGEAASRAAGYSDSGYRDDATGLRINCTVQTVATDGAIWVVLTAPEG